LDMPGREEGMLQRPGDCLVLRAERTSDVVIGLRRGSADGSLDASFRLEPIILADEAPDAKPASAPAPAPLSSSPISPIAAIRRLRRTFGPAARTRRPPWRACRLLRKAARLRWKCRCWSAVARRAGPSGSARDNMQARAGMACRWLASGYGCGLRSSASKSPPRRFFSALWSRRSAVGRWSLSVLRESIRWSA